MEKIKDILNNKNKKLNNNDDKDRSYNKDKKFSDVYPISVNSQQCIGPCYYSGTQMIHPLTLDEIKNKPYNFCPVKSFVKYDPETKKNSISIIDKCYVPTARATTADDLTYYNVAAPQMHFSSDYFIKIYYKIFTIEEFLYWLDTHKNDPYRTRQRVFDNCMVVFGNKINIIDHRMIEYINEIMIHNLQKLYDALSIYININTDDGIITLMNIVNNKYQIYYDKDQIKIAKNYIKEKFLGIDNIQQFMSKFIRYYKEEMTDNHISNILVLHMIDYIIKRIKLTLELNP